MTYSYEQLKAMCPLSISECSQKHVQSVVAELIETALAQPASVPAGWKLVPVEPTDDMIHAGYMKLWGDQAARSDAESCWSAMLAAAPQAPQPAQAEILTRDEARRYCAAGFQEWLDDAVADGGLTVFDMLTSVHDAYSGFQAAGSYAPQPAQAVQGAAEGDMTSCFRAELPPLPDWSKRDDLGGLVPSEIRVALRVYARAAITAHEAARAANVQPKGTGELEQRKRDYARALDSIKGHVEYISLLEQKLRELQAFKDGVELHQRGGSNSWYWLDDRENYLETMVASLPVVIRAEQLRKLLATSQSPAPVAEERGRLRAAQAAAVMPMIGPLLDAWESADREVMGEEPELSKWLTKINSAMESAGDEPAAPSAQAEPTTAMGHVYKEAAQRMDAFYQAFNGKQAEQGGK